MIVFHEMSQKELDERSSRKVCNLKSIKQMLNEEQSMVEKEFCLTISLRIKALVIKGLISKNQSQGKEKIKRYFFKWYAKRNQERPRRAIDQFVTSGNLSKEKIFYKIKIAIRQCLSIGSQELQKLQTIENKREINCQGLSHQNKFQASIKHMIIQSENILSCNSAGKDVKRKSDCYRIKRIQENNAEVSQRNRESISYINPTSGQLRVDLETCTNLFENSESVIKKESKQASIVEVAKFSTRLETKLVALGFRKIMALMLEEDYEQELQKARRNLELVEQNFLVECEMETLSHNCEEQSQRLEIIDKNIETLREKLLYSRTVALLRILRRLFYPRLAEFFSNQKVQSRPHEENQESRNIYEIHEFGGISSTSLSNMSSSKTLENQTWKNQNKGFNLMQLDKIEQNI